MKWFQRRDDKDIDRIIVGDIDLTSLPRSFLIKHCSNVMRFQVKKPSLSVDAGIENSLSSDCLLNELEFCFHLLLGNCHTCRLRKVTRTLFCLK